MEGHQCTCVLNFRAGEGSYLLFLIGGSDGLYDPVPTHLSDRLRCIFFGSWEGPVADRGQDPATPAMASVFRPNCQARKTL
jgi:hypothetical protein